MSALQRDEDGSQASEQLHAGPQSRPSARAPPALGPRPSQQRRRSWPSFVHPHGTKKRMRTTFFGPFLAIRSRNELAEAPDPGAAPRLGFGSRAGRVVTPAARVGTCLGRRGAGGGGGAQAVARAQSTSLFVPVTVARAPPARGSVRSVSRCPRYRLSERLRSCAGRPSPRAAPPRPSPPPPPA